MMRLLTAGLSVAAALLAGCQATHLAYVYEANIGLDVAYSQNGNPKVVFGYDRGTFALVPQRQDTVAPCPGESAPPGDKGELMTLTAVSLVNVDGLDDVTIDHFVATGDAALRVSKDSAGLKQIRKSIFSEESQ
jgi:hypothetical protein